MHTIASPKEPTLYFIGVSTSQSSIMRLFPKWAQVWGIQATIAGIDAPIGASAEVYRDIVAHIKHHPHAKGALVTTHKLDLYQAADDLFEVLDPYARRCAEVSCISKRGKSLIGHAKDPITAGLALEAFVPEGHWQRTHADVLCLGAGGAASALTLYLVEQPQPPKRIVVVDIDAARLAHVKALHETCDTKVIFDYHLHASAADNDALLATFPPESMIINATGMGKDRPGSPLTDQGEFPEKALVWELNYRGPLDFLQQARRQQQAKALHIEDGWVYFLHGWTQVITEVFDNPLTPELFPELDQVASQLRGG